MNHHRTWAHTIHGPSLYMGPYHTWTITEYELSPYMGYYHIWAITVHVSLYTGAGESGKSTIVKQMKILHLDGYSDQ